MRIRRPLKHLVILLLPLVMVTTSGANLLIPDGGSTGDAQIERKGSQAAAAFLRGAGTVYIMLSKVEMKEADVSGDIKKAVSEFGMAQQGCAGIKDEIGQNARAQRNLASRKPSLQELQAKYEAARMLQKDESEQRARALSLAMSGELSKLVELCAEGAGRVINALNVYRPSQVDSWKLMYRLEQELQLLRYAAVLVEGPLDPK